MVCSVEGCGRSGRITRGMCSMHYQRWCKTGTPGSADRARGVNSGLCSVDGCNLPMRKVGLCAGHYAHGRRHGDARAPFSYRWGDGGYTAAHNLVKRRRGSAADHSCIDCGRPAQEWSYRGGDPLARAGATGMPYSRDPNYYDPRCIPCHRRYDGWHEMISRVVRHG